MATTDSRPLCRYFMHGACKNKECKFSHDFSKAPSMVCKYYLQGHCAYGENCRYDHIRPQWTKPTSTPLSSSATAHIPRRPAIVATSTPAGLQPGGDETDVAGQLPDDLWGSDDDEASTAAAASTSTTSAWQPGANKRWAQVSGGAAGDVSAADPSAASSSVPVRGADQPALEPASGFQGCGQAVQGAGAEYYQSYGAYGEEGDVGGEGEAGYAAGWGEYEGYGQEWGGWEGDAEAGTEQEGEEGPPDLASTQLCGQYSAYGSCAAGDTCRYVHGNKCPTCNKHVLHPYNQADADAHTQECAHRHNKLAARLRSAQVECGICLEKVLSAASASDRRFGLLSCDHAFCLKCIRAWRSTGSADVDTAVRACPVCRSTSHFITPSLIWPADAQEKEAIVNAYKDKLATIDCMHFKQGEGSCPFGTSCFYRHMHKDGRLESREPSLRTAQDESGGVRVLSTVRLSDYFQVRRPRR